MDDADVGGQISRDESGEPHLGRVRQSPPKKSHLKPWLKKQWCIGELTGEYLAKMEDVLAVYARSESQAEVLICFDEKPFQLLAETVAPLAATAGGKPRREDYQYSRRGTCNVLCAVAPYAGKRWAKVTQQRRKPDYAEFVKEISEQIRAQMPAVEKILLVQDNLNTHTAGAFYERFEASEARELTERFEFHFTPKKGSWLNMAEIELSCLSRNCLDRRIATQEEVARQLAVRVDSRNGEKAQIKWQFTISKAREKFKQYYKH